MNKEISQQDIKFITHAILGLELEGKISSKGTRFAIDRINMDASTFEVTKKTDLLNDYLSYKEVADLFSVSVSTIRNWRRERLLTPINITHTTVVFEKAEVAALYKKRKDLINTKVKATKKTQESQEGA